VQYRFDWDASGSGDISGWTSLGASGHTGSLSNSWSSPDTYVVKVQAKDQYGKEGLWSNGLTVVVSSNPPNKPGVPSGTSSGMHCTQYTYTASTTDPDSGEQLWYWFDWDDGTNSGWDGPYNSGVTTNPIPKTWNVPGNYDVTVKAKNSCDTESVWSDPLTVTMGNTAPPIPNTPSGHSSGYHCTSYSYSTSAVTDPESCDTVEYMFVWGDGTDSGWKSSPSASHVWDNPGTYDVKVKARDNWGAESGLSSALSVFMDNHDPNTPSTPSGPSNRAVDQPGDYSTSATDPDGCDTVEYKFDWGDGTDSGWIGSPSASHTWSTKGTYVVTAQAKDEHGAESGWSGGLSVEVTKEQPPIADANGPYTGPVGQPVQFDGSGSDDPDGQIESYDWDFGDGDTGSGVNPTHTYVASDIYTVTLTVTDDDGLTDTDITTAEIGRPSVGIEKLVSADGGVTWSDEVTADVDDMVRFRITVHNDGSYDLTNIKVADTLPECLEYKDNAIPKEPDSIVGNKLTWEFPGPLKYCNTITIEFDAQVISEGENINWATVTADSDEGDVYDSDSATVWAGKPVPKIGCGGTLSWTSVKPGSTQTGTITVKNTGDPGSQLKWKCDEQNTWGSWTFTPSNGIGLTPAMGSLSITVTVVAPTEEDQEYSGQITLCNEEDSTDTCTIDVSLSTPRNRAMQTPFLQFLQNFLENHPILYQLLQQFLHL